MMKIVVDVTFLKDQFANRGIGVASREIISRIIQNKDVEWLLLGFEDDKSNLELLNVSKDSNIHFISLGKVRFSSPRNLLLFQTKFLPKIKKINPDLYFAMNFERGLPIGFCKTAVFIHDIIPLVTNRFSSRGVIFNFFKGLFWKYAFNRAKKADLIFTNSNFTKDELVKKGSINEEKVKVAYLGVAECFRNEKYDSTDEKKVLKSLNIKKPYFLYYGGFEPNKNTDKILSSFRVFLRSYPEYNFVIIGSGFKFTKDSVIPVEKNAKDFYAKIIELNLMSNLRIVPSQDLKSLVQLLRNSSAFVHLSKYEGFGLSVLEAMSAGVPVIAANKSSYPEILGDGALLVDPDKIEGAARAMEKVIKDEEFLKNLKQKAYLQSRKFSWELCSKKIYTGMKEMVF